MNKQPNNDSQKVHYPHINDDTQTPKPKDELLKQLCHTGRTTPEYLILQAALYARCAADIEEALQLLRDSVEAASKSSSCLSKRLLWLNVVLTIATAVGALATLLMALKAMGII